MQPKWYETSIEYKTIKIVVKWRVRKIDHISKLFRKIVVRNIDLLVYCY